MKPKALLFPERFYVKVLCVFKAILGNEMLTSPSIQLRAASGGRGVSIEGPYEAYTRVSYSDIPDIQGICRLPLLGTPLLYLSRIQLLVKRQCHPWVIG